MQKIKYFLISNLLLLTSLFTSCNNKNYQIMIVGVNEPKFNEIGILISQLSSRKIETIDNINFYTGTIENKSVVIAESPVGMTGAAMTTTIGIKEFSPRYIISEGSCGGHHKDVHLNDIILGQTIYNFASYKGDPQNPGEEFALSSPTLYSDNNLIKIAREIDYQKGKVIENGIISSCDSWNTGKKYISFLHSKFSEDCEEMESYAVTSVANNYKIPSIAIRGISNNIITAEGYTEEAGENVQQFVLDFIKSI